jgi:hypothetical protein
MDSDWTTAAFRDRLALTAEDAEDAEEGQEEFSALSAPTGNRSGIESVAAALPD